MVRSATVQRTTRPRSLLPLLLPLLVAFFAGGARAQEEAAPRSGPSGASSDRAATWYAESYNRGERGFLVTHYWSKGQRFRAEIVVAGHRVVNIVNGDHYYVLDALGQTGVAIQRSAAALRADPTRGRPFGREFDRLLRQGGEKIKTEQLGGRECDLYRVTNDSGRFEVCATPTEPHLPIRVTTFNRKSGASDNVDYINWLSGIAIPDSFFEPDPRIELERVTYEDYRKRSLRERVGPAPALFGFLLHGEPD